MVSIDGAPLVERSRRRPMTGQQLENQSSSMEGRHPVAIL